MAKQYKKILVPVDGSDQAYNAVREGVMLAQWSEAELIVLTVKDLVRYYGIANYGIVETPGLDKLANDILLKVGSIIPAESKFKTQILSDSPKREIVQYAKENDIDLIVMGATGAGAFDRLLAGSTTNYVVNHAPCGVTIVQG
ncbi:universal stress protein [Lactococcus lactis]|uniref:universal stress protein n=1 Tax=Lactococcus lactis TaxID=1358 RepID=UPI0021A7295B|nr:universal stress protein [Lactococcus lactis]MCT3124980.1 universal stress protein [Lactococcus lactis]